MVYHAWQNSSELKMEVSSILCLCPPPPSPSFPPFSPVLPFSPLLPFLLCSLSSLFPFAPSLSSLPSSPHSLVPSFTPLFLSLQFPLASPPSIFKGRPAVGSAPLLFSFTPFRLRQGATFFSGRDTTFVSTLREGGHFCLKREGGHLCKREEGHVCKREGGL